MSDTIQAYVEHVERLLSQRQEALTEADLQEIAREIGMTDADFEAVENEVQARYERGIGFVDHKMWDDAVREFAEAAAMAPTRVYVLHSLANAYFGRGLKAGSRDDFDAAESYSRRCLNIDPQYEAAFVLLSEIKQNRTVVQDPPRVLSTRIALYVLGASLLLCVFGGSAATVVAVILKPELAETPAETGSKPPSLEEAAIPIVGSKPVVVSVDSNLETPVVFDAGRWKGKLALEMRSSKNSVYTDKAYYEWKGLIVNTGDTDITEVKAKLELRNDAGETLLADLIDLSSDYEPTLRPGDVKTFFTTKSSDASVTEARVTLSTVKEEPAATVSESPKLAFVWGIKKPEHVQLEIREREARFSDNAIMKAGFFSGVWEIKNTGKNHIKTVKVRLKVMDAGDKTLEDRSWLVAFSSSPGIRPGETRLAHTTLKVPTTFDHYVLSVIEID